MRKYKIYKYINKINNKVYIGQTCRSLRERAGCNGINYKDCIRFYRAILKYGWDSFYCEILKDGLSQEEANYWECYYISFYESRNQDKGYNIMVGGDNKIMPKEFCDKISLLAKERYKDPTKNPMYGKHHSSDSLKLMSEIKKGKNNPMYGKHLSDESKAKISNSNKGKTASHKIWTDEDRLNASIRFREIAKAWTRKVLCVEDNKTFDSVLEASKYYGVAKGTLSGHLHGSQKTCKGKHFQFID